MQSIELPPCEICAEPAGRRCAKCRSVHYCSEACQRLHWPRHKQCCSAQKKPRKPPTLDTLEAQLHLLEAQAHEQFETTANAPGHYVGGPAPSASDGFTALRTRVPSDSSGYRALGREFRVRIPSFHTAANSEIFGFCGDWWKIVVHVKADQSVGDCDARVYVNMRCKQGADRVCLRVRLVRPEGFVPPDVPPSLDPSEYGSKFWTDVRPGAVLQVAPADGLEMPLEYFVLHKQRGDVIVAVHLLYEWLGEGAREWGLEPVEVPGSTEQTWFPDEDPASPGCRPGEVWEDLYSYPKMGRPWIQ